MNKKRYAIVRVDNKCPVNLEEDISTVDRIKMFDCIGKRQCGDCQYGDTKEQLIKKIAQILFQESPHNVLYTNPDKVVNEFFYNDCLKTATKIVEFLGVEE